MEMEQTTNHSQYRRNNLTRSDETELLKGSGKRSENKCVIAFLVVILLAAAAILFMSIIELRYISKLNSNNNIYSGEEVKTLPALYVHNSILDETSCTSGNVTAVSFTYLNSTTRASLYAFKEQYNMMDQKYAHNNHCKSKKTITNLVVFCPVFIQEPFASISNKISRLRKSLFPGRLFSDIFLNLSGVLDAYIKNGEEEHYYGLISEIHMGNSASELRNLSNPDYKGPGIIRRCDIILICKVF